MEVQGIWVVVRRAGVEIQEVWVVVVGPVRGELVGAVSVGGGSDVLGVRERKGRPNRGRPSR